MRISDWSSDVCSSDLSRTAPSASTRIRVASCSPMGPCGIGRGASNGRTGLRSPAATPLDRKIVGKGKSVSVGVDLGERSIIKTNIQILTSHHILQQCLQQRLRLDYHY